MVLPSGVNKGTGMEEALKELGLSRHNVIGIGDAENDHAFLSLCELSIAVDNALEAGEKGNVITSPKRITAPVWRKGQYNKFSLTNWQNSTETA